jgi:peptide/nickel transport system permease protein
MRHRIIRRLVSGLGLVLAVVTLTFILINLAPGDPARLWVGPNATADDLAAARAALGLDRPLPVRFVTWIGRFAIGEWGTSLVQQRPVTDVILAALPHTIVLTAGSLLITFGIGVVVGAWQARYHRGRSDRVTSIAALAVQGMPAYWLAVMLVLVFAYWSARFGWPAWLRLPAMGVTSLDADFLSPTGRFVDRLRHLTLPLATLGAIGAAGTSRFVRGAVLDVQHEPFIRAAAARGLEPGAIRRRYVIRNALIPVITLLGLSLPALFSGTVFVEVIFAWPGMGREIVTAVAGRDYPVVMAVTVIFAVLVIAANALADALYGIVDPRLRRAR